MTLWRQRVRVVLTYCDERAWHDMGNIFLGGVKRFHDVREKSLQHEQEAEAGKQREIWQYQWGRTSFSTRKDFCYLLVFLVIWKCRFAWICHFKFRKLKLVVSCNSYFGGLVYILVELEWLVLPAINAFFLRYPVPAIFVTLLNWHEIQRLWKKWT